MTKPKNQGGRPTMLAPGETWVRHPLRATSTFWARLMKERRHDETKSEYILEVLRLGLRARQRTNRKAEVKERELE